MMPMLEARGLSVSFGRLMALQGVDLALAPGERHALIGPNGAGKTTLINVLTGAVAADEGTVMLDGRNVTGLATDQRVRQGLVRTFQVNSLFPGLTVHASLALAISEREGLGNQWWRRMPKSVSDEAACWLDSMSLGNVAQHPVARLPYGQQRLVEIALALVCRPRVLLLDEPAAGLPADETRAMLDRINGLPGDMAVLLIEHDMGLVFGFAQTISVLAQGRVVARGTPEQIEADEQVRAIYLGPSTESGAGQGR